MAHRSCEAPFEIQQAVFKTILRRSKELGGKVLSIHSRRAAAVLILLSSETDYGTAVLHWFSGSLKEMRLAVEIGCWFSIGPAMLRSNKGKELVSEMPRERILTESDGPFARLGNSPVKPFDILLAEKEIASIWQLPLDQTQTQLGRNFSSLVG